MGVVDWTAIALLAGRRGFMGCRPVFDNFG